MKINFDREMHQVLSKKLRSERPEEEREAVKIVAVDLQVRCQQIYAFVATLVIQS